MSVGTIPNTARRETPRRALPSSAITANVQAGQGSSFGNLLTLPHVEKPFWRGMPIYAPGDSAAHLYQVISGRVKIVRASLAGQHKILAIHYRGEVFGEQALLASAANFFRSDEAIALETTRVAVIRAEDFWRARGTDPKALQQVLQEVMTRLAAAQQQIESLTFDNNHRRLALALFQQYENALRTGENCVRLTHEELAELIGSSREVVTSLMLELRAQGLIEYRRGCTRPCLAELQRFLAEG